MFVGLHRRVATEKGVAETPAPLAEVIGSVELATASPRDDDDAPTVLGGAYKVKGNGSIQWAPTGSETPSNTVYACRVS